MKSIPIIILLMAAVFLLGCQVSERLQELTADSAAAAESPEEREIADGLDEFDDLNQILDEDINLEEFEGLELE